MIGNDVVDLELAARESNWRRKGFLTKVFTKPEQQIITSAQDPDGMVWLLWSMKEAAYKAHQREFNLPRRLNWLVLKCELREFSNEQASGLVAINEKTYYTTSKITLDYIYTSAEKAKNIGAKNVIFEAPSSEVKKHLLQEISSFYSLDPQQLQIKKDKQGIPFFSYNNDFSFSRFSLSGHGRYTSYMLSLINCESRVKQS